MNGDLLDRLERQLVDATRVGAVPRRRRLRLRIARWVSTPLAVGAIGVAVSATAIAADVTGHLPGSSSPPVKRPAAHAARPTRAARSASASHFAAGPSVLTSAGFPVGGPVPSGFKPQSFTAISELTWWLMGPAPCSDPPCTSIVRTTNGCASFVGLPAPRTDDVSQLRFANAPDGYAFGPELWTTRDGGESWKRAHPGGSVNALAAARGYVFAIVWRGDRAWLARSRTGGSTWKRLRVGGSAEPLTLWVQGSEVILETQAPKSGGQDVYISKNSGATFVRVGTPPPSVECSFASTGGSVIWAPCATGTLSGVWRSTDGGHSFASADGSSGQTRLPELPNSAAFGAASGRTAVAGYDSLWRTTDGGRRWRAVSGLATAVEWTYLGFTDSTHGVAIGQFSTSPRWRLYYTTDAGASYHYVPILP